MFFFSSIGPHRDARSKVGKRSADICSAKTKQKRCPPPPKGETTTPVQHVNLHSRQRERSNRRDKCRLGWMASQIQISDYFYFNFEWGGLGVGELKGTPTKAAKKRGGNDSLKMGKRKEQAMMMSVTKINARSVSPFHYFFTRNNDNKKKKVF